MYKKQKIETIIGLEKYKILNIEEKNDNEETINISNKSLSRKNKGSNNYIETLNKLKVKDMIIKKTNKTKSLRKNIINSTFGYILNN